MVMSNLQAAIRASIDDSLSTDQLCSRVNRMMCDNLAPGKFITFFYCILDSRDGTLAYTNAGHNPPILIRRDGERLRLKEGGAVLGALPDWMYESGRARLGAGDRLLLFTDGLIEARSPADEEFGEARLLGLLNDNRELSSGQLKANIVNALAEFNAGALQDDLTFIVVAAPS